MGVRAGRITRPNRAFEMTGTVASKRTVMAGLSSRLVNRIWTTV
jgi:hypothetical protein